MRCRSCGRSVSLWQRNLFSRVCTDCQRLAELEGVLRTPLSLLPYQTQLQAGYSYCARLLKMGTSPADVLTRLTQLGIEPDVAARIVDTRVAEFAQREKRKNPGKGIAIIGLGILVFMGGGLLYMGNQSGAFVTFPFAGFLTMGLVGQRHFSNRAKWASIPPT